MNIKQLFETDQKTAYQVRLSKKAPWKSVQLLHGIVLTKHWHPITENETYDIYKPVQQYVEIEKIPNTEIALSTLPEKSVTIIDRKTKKIDLVKMAVERDLGITTVLMKKTKADLIKLLELGDLE